MPVANVEAVKFLVLVEDMDRAISFYRKALGLVIRFESPAWTELSFGDAILALHGGGRQDRRRTSLSIQVSDIEAACEAVAEAGGQVVQNPEEQQGEPLVVAAVTDTEGNEFSLVQYVG